MSRPTVDWHGDVYLMDAEGEFVEQHHGGESA